ncbi:MAG: transposase [Bifidobacterium sp.]|nr:transposase [Bifidobacterium sp.]
MLASDGMRGMTAAANAEWPGTRLRRCLVHVHRDTNRDLTHRPRAQAARELRKLSSKLFEVRTAEGAARWGEALNAWYRRWRDAVNERTTAKGDPSNPKAGAGRKWWWTHERLRRCYKRLERLFRDDSLFAYTDPALTAGGPVPRNANGLEGGVNSPVKRMLDDHRGMPRGHMMRACEWKCYTRSERPDTGALPDTYLENRNRRGKRMEEKERLEEAATGDEPGLDRASVQLPGSGDPAVNAYESGFGIRHGWAGTGS